MPINRSQLHQSHFADFKAFAATRGYVAEPTKGDYEVIRLRLTSGGAPLLFFQRLRSDHATVQTAEANRLVTEYIRSRRSSGETRGEGVA